MLLQSLDETETLEPHSPRQAVAQRTTWVSIGVNSGLTTIQILIGCITASQGLIADGLHSLSDLLSDGVVLWASKHSHKAPDDDHHYGHHRYETAATLALGMILLLVGIGMANSAILTLTKVLTVPAQTLPALALWIAFGGVIAKELLFRFMLAEAERIRSSLLVANAWHARTDAASSLIVALGILGSLLGYPALDPVAALIVGLIVCKMGWAFAWDALHDLMDRSVEDKTLAQIRHTLLHTEGVLGIHDLRTRKVGDFIWVDVHIEVNGHITVVEGHDIGVRAKDELMQAMPSVLNVMTHIDPV